MVRILISLFNSIFFSALSLIFFHNWLITGLVAAAVWSITFFALCLATMAQRGNNVQSEINLTQSSEEITKPVSRAVEIKHKLPVPAKR